MRRYTVKRNSDTKTVSQLINSLETDNKDVDAILEAARLQRIEQKERSKNRLKMVGILSLTIVMVTIIVLTYLADALLLGVPIAMSMCFAVAMFCDDFLAKKAPIKGLVYYTILPILLRHYYDIISCFI